MWHRYNYIYRSKSQRKDKESKTVAYNCRGDNINLRNAFWFVESILSSLLWCLGADYGFHYSTNLADSRSDCDNHSIHQANRANKG